MERDFESRYLFLLAGFVFISLSVFGWWSMFQVRAVQK